MLTSCQSAAFQNELLSEPGIFWHSCLESFMSTEGLNAPTVTENECKDLFLFTKQLCQHHNSPASKLGAESRHSELAS